MVGRPGRWLQAPESRESERPRGTPARPPCAKEPRPEASAREQMKPAGGEMRQHFFFFFLLLEEVFLKNQILFAPCVSRHRRHSDPSLLSVQSAASPVQTNCRLVEGRPEPAAGGGFQQEAGHSTRASGGAGTRPPLGDDDVGMGRRGPGLPL